MSFPASPLNGDLATINGKVYQYNSTDNKWSLQTAATAYQSTTVDATGNITGGNLITSGIVYAPEIDNGNSNIRIAANANVSISSTGTANVLVVSNTGAYVTGNIYVGGAVVPTQDQTIAYTFAF